MHQLIRGQSRLGWVGVGIMGNYMCGHVLNNDIFRNTILYNRTKKKCEDFMALHPKKVEIADSVSQVGDQSDVVITMVGHPSDVEEVILSDKGVLSSMKPGSILIDMTTTPPNLAQTIYKEAKSKGIFSLDAPVTGAMVGARAGSLSIMVGGDKEAYDNVLPVFQAMGKSIRYQGGPGKGQHTKMANQIQIANTMMGVCESLIYGYSAGLDLDSVIDIIDGGGAANWSNKNLGPRMIRRDFDPGFMIEHFVKDLGICLDEADRMNLTLPGLTKAYELHETVQKLGFNRLGNQALLLALEKLNNIEINIDIK